VIDPGGDIEGEVMLAEKTGADQNLHVTVGGADVVATVPRGVPVQAGQRVRLQLPQDRIHLFALDDGRRL
jgi:ABC-type sugar transport system ATPase subunit